MIAETDILVIQRGDKENIYDLFYQRTPPLVTRRRGGYGNPLERDRHRVRMDIIHGKISPRAAKEIYGYEDDV